MNYHYLTAADCERILQFRDQSPCHPRADKEPFDTWFTFHKADRFRKNVFFRGTLNFFDILPDEAMGQLHCVTLPAQFWGGPLADAVERHILFIQVTTPPCSGLNPAVRDSPIAILDYHYGSNSHVDAPLWTRLHHTMNFRMGRGVAAKLFAKLALTPDNLVERGVSHELVEWACYAAAYGTPRSDSGSELSTPPITIGPDIKEVWFAGTHSDIGGGTKKNLELNLSSVTVLWMENEATLAGLRLEPPANGGVWNLKELDHDNLHESLEGLYRLMEYFPMRRLSYKDPVDLTR
ncbi:hypothetical protein DFH06DRAFT_1316817 [Mycena polygramma]|nr:hypothetical protein DFH06DRAFT_1316817 [Mycena polygramma]